MQALLLPQSPLLLPARHAQLGAACAALPATTTDHSVAAGQLLDLLRPALGAAHPHQPLTPPGAPLSAPALHC